MLKYIIILLFVLTEINLFAQPKLRIDPGNVRFKDVFSRYSYTFIINEGNETLQIDSITNSRSFYIIDFDNGRQLPFSINPGDTAKLNITLANFYNITVSDTADTLFIHSNDPGEPGDIRIKIDFFDDDYGLCTGKVTDELLNPVENSEVYFFYWGVYLFDSTSTNAAGDYSASLPEGNYTVGVSRPGYRTVFSGNTADPFYAQTVKIDSGETVSIDLEMQQLVLAEYSVSGKLINPVSGTAVSKGVVVIRKGTHTPTLRKFDSVNDLDVYSGFVSGDGVYKIAVEDSAYYFVQGYSGYFLPAFYNAENSPSLFWQEADSINLNSVQENRNIYLLRDSSYGAGKAYGQISVPVQANDKYEGITLFAQSTANGIFYSYNFSRNDGTFNISNLPYGTYKIVAQKVGYSNSESNEFSIDSLNQSVYDISVSFNLSGISENIMEPGEFIILPNYPNPFNPSTTISFTLPDEQFVQITAFDMLGQKISDIGKGLYSAGLNTVLFEAGRLSSGVYIIAVQTQTATLTQKIMLMK